MNLKIEPFEKFKGGKYCNSVVYKCEHLSYDDFTCNRYRAKLGSTPVEYMPGVFSDRHSRIIRHKKCNE